MKKLGYLVLAMFSSLMLAACAQQKSEEKEKEVITTSANQSDWSYEEPTGPESWGELDPSNLTCVNGSEQSPVNVEFPEVVEDRKLKGTEIHYESTSITLENNGHTIQANPTKESNKIIIENNEYKLSQFHFHTPSEHQFNGQNYDMELHLVHSDENGKLAVIGLMIQEGNENKLLASIWSELPTDKTAKGNSEKYNIDLQALLPENKTTFEYAGSLTTPPCTEEVQWVVFEQPIEMSKAQIEAFRLIFPDNHRPVQPINEREINKNGE